MRKFAGVYKVRDVQNEGRARRIKKNAVISAYE
jgi:hypothetical protein